MATVARRRLGRADHDIPLTLAEYEAADYEPGAKYELVRGRLAVSPSPNLSESLLEQWLFLIVEAYSRRRPDVINFVSYKARVFVPGGGLTSAPEPDLAAYPDFPVDAVLNRAVRWQDLSPLLVGEVVSPDDPEKHYVRNVELYLDVPSVREYWILDGGDDPGRPTLTVYRRRGARWQKPIRHPSGDTYTTRLLPGFALLIDPRQSPGH